MFDKKNNKKRNPLKIDILNPKIVKLFFHKV